MILMINEQIFSTIKVLEFFARLIHFIISHDQWVLSAECGTNNHDSSQK